MYSCMHMSCMYTRKLQITIHLLLDLLPLSETVCCLLSAVFERRGIKCRMQKSESDRKHCAELSIGFRKAESRKSRPNPPKTGPIFSIMLALSYEARLVHPVPMCHARRKHPAVPLGREQVDYSSHQTQSGPKHHPTAQI